MTTMHRTHARGGRAARRALPSGPSVLAAVAVLALLSGCAGGARQVPIRGDERAVDTLAGEWVGDYAGVDSGRRGKIRFRLTVGRHTASGEVVMFPVGEAAPPRTLRIQFVEIEDGGGVSGVIAPYVDPQCQCRVRTEFLGRVTGHSMEGTFETRGVSDGGGDGPGERRVQSGTWEVERTDS